jgi:hypothetical protein
MFNLGFTRSNKDSIQKKRFSGRNLKYKQVIKVRLLRSFGKHGVAIHSRLTPWTSKSNATSSIIRARIVQSVERLDCSGIESRWGPEFPHPSRPALGPTPPPIQLIPGNFRGQSDREVGLTPPPPSNAEGKEREELYV